jgi:hypothetical protein
MVKRDDNGIFSDLRNYDATRYSFTYGVMIESAGDVRSSVRG